MDGLSHGRLPLLAFDIYGHCHVSGVAGLRPFSNGTLVVSPIVPAAELPWWAVDGVLLHGRIVSVAFDADGSKYGAGAGLRVLVDGKIAASSAGLARLSVDLLKASWH